jgi:HK97 gp10 family phage protein
MTTRVVGLSLEGAADMRAKLEKISEELRGKVLRNAVEEGAEPILAAARAKAPVLKAPAAHRLRGLLKTLIKAWFPRTVRPGKVTMQIGVDLRELARFLPPGARKKGDAPDFLYPMFQEYGTTKDEAQPFLRPAIDEQRENAVARVITVIQRNLRRFEERQG